MDPARDSSPVPRTLANFLRDRLPLLVWIAAAVTVTWVLGSRIRSHEFIGLAQALRYEVSPATSGTIAQVLVKPLGRVEAGAVVARLDDKLLRAQIETANASAIHLTAELDAERARMTAGEGPLAEGYNADLRRFQIDEEQLSLQALNIRVQLESDKVEAERLALDSERYGKLFEARLVSEQERENARLAYERIAVRIERNSELLTQTMEQQADAQRRRKEFERSHPATAAAESAPALRPLSEAVKVQASRLEELRIQMQGLVLRSPVAGQVSQVLCQQGQAVVPGEAVVVIYEEIPKEVMAYLPESAAGSVRESTRVMLTRRSDPRRTAESYVTRVGAAIEATPQQLWRNPHIPEYGLPVAIAATPALNLTPGEAVFVQTLRAR